MNSSQLVVADVIATKLYALWEGNSKIIGVSDSEEILAPLMKNDDDFFIEELDAANGCEIIDASNAANVDDFDIIENDTEKQYGFSEVYTKEDKFDITMFKYRLCLSDYSESTSYFDMITEFTENSGSWETVDTPALAVAQHSEYWTRYYDADSFKGQHGTIPPLHVFRLDDDLAKLLLRTGFKSRMILLSVKSDE